MNRNIAIAFTLLFNITSPLLAQPPKGPAAPPAQRVFVATARVQTLDEPKTFVGPAIPFPYKPPPPF